MWRSLLAHLTRGQGVAGSNPVIPTIFAIEKGQSDDWLFVFLPFDSLSDSLRLSIGASNAYQLTYLTSMKTGFE